MAVIGDPLTDISRFDRVGFVTKKEWITRTTLSSRRLVWGRRGIGGGRRTRCKQCPVLWEVIITAATAPVPDDSPLLRRHTGTQDIYALEWKTL